MVLILVTMITSHKSGLQIAFYLIKFVAGLIDKINEVANETV